MVQSPQSVDVLIIGAGAAGLSAALAAHEAGATVAVIEKADKLGGTAAISGGIVWMPQNAWMADAGMSDSRDEAIAYFEGLNHGDIDPARLGAFVDEGPTALGKIALRGLHPQMCQVALDQCRHGLGLRNRQSLHPGCRTCPRPP
ncbi:MAG: FAD-dependent oxidoreductase, partial [Pseudomonadota bacterium]